MNRLFLALKVVINDYEKLQSDFSEVIDGRWIESQNLHITICYFGNRYSIDELLEKLPSLLLPIEPISLDSLSYFKSNKILYAGTNTHALDQLNSSINTYFSIEQTKRFVPHATLMRVKKVNDEKIFKHLLESYKNIDIGRVDTTFQLMNSHIEHPGGARYECIKSWKV